MRALETFSQLVYKPEAALANPRNSFGLVSGRSRAGVYEVRQCPWSISDRPRYGWRGLLLDVSRNFFPVSSIERTIRGMAYAKLNTLHLHITDAQTFPIELKDPVAQVLTHGYTGDKVYTQEQIVALVKYGIQHGVRIVPEFDTPAHATSWQGRGGAYADMITCNNAEPWTDYCYQPPCGQLSPLNTSRSYEVMGRVIGEMAALFPDEYFHVGADEPFTACWNHSRAVREWLEANGYGWRDADANYTRGMKALSDYFSREREG